MSPQTQVEASFVDSLKSEGPRPTSDSAASPHSPFKSGLDPESQFVYGEDEAEFPALQKEYFDRFLPFTPEERFQVDTLVRSEWSIRRLFRVEAHLWEYHAMCSDRSSGVPLGEGFNRASEVFMRLQRRVSASERSYKEAYKELGRLQGIRTSAPVPVVAGVQPQPLAAQRQPEPQPTTAETAPLSSSPNSPLSAPAFASAAAATVTPQPQPGPVTETRADPPGRRVDRPLPPRPDPASLARRTRPQASQ